MAGQNRFNSQAIRTGYAAMKDVRDHPFFEASAGIDAMEADAYARMMEDVLIDIDELDVNNCPPDRRFFLKDKEAWVYEHGNIVELVYVRTYREDAELV